VTQLIAMISRSNHGPSFIVQRVGRPVDAAAPLVATPAAAIPRMRISSSSWPRAVAIRRSCGGASGAPGEPDRPRGDGEGGVRPAAVTDFRPQSRAPLVMPNA
jgi:hypothetical protein